MNLIYIATFSKLEDNFYSYFFYDASCSQYVVEVKKSENDYKVYTYSLGEKHCAEKKYNESISDYI